MKIGPRSKEYNPNNQIIIRMRQAVTSFNSIDDAHMYLHKVEEFVNDRKVD